MCNHCDDHHHHHHHHPETVQLMPVQNQLYAVYQTPEPLPFATVKADSGMSLVPVLFMGLIRHGDKSMVEGFFASSSVQSCEDIDGFKGYAASLEDAQTLYS